MAIVLRSSCKFLPNSGASACFGRLSSPVAVTHRCFSSSKAPRNKIDPPNVLQLAEKARITLTPQEVEEFRPKLEQIVDWFGQLQDVDLENISPAVRVDVGGQSTLRSDVPSFFENREAMLAAVPETEGPFIKVPKILNENME